MELVDPIPRVRQRATPFPSARQCLLTVAFAVAVAGVGALVALAPALALVLGLAAVFAGVLTSVRRIPVATVVVLGALAVAATVDYPRRFVVGPTTAYAWITALIASLLALISVSRYVLVAVRGTGRVLWPLYAFASWALLSMVWFRPSLDGIQNTFVYVAFATLPPVTAAAVIRGDLKVETARRAITGTILFASALMVGNIAQGGINNGSYFIGIRSYALVGVVGVAWGVGHGRAGDRRTALLAPLCWLLIILSLSRLAFAASLLIIILGSLDVRTVGRFVKSLPGRRGGCGPRLLLGDVVRPAGLSVSTTGGSQERRWRFGRRHGANEPVAHHLGLVSPLADHRSGRRIGRDGDQASARGCRPATRRLPAGAPRLRDHRPGDSPRSVRRASATRAPSDARNSKGDPDALHPSRGGAGRGRPAGRHGDRQRNRLPLRRRSDLGHPRPVDRHETRPGGQGRGRSNGDALDGRAGWTTPRRSRACSVC